MLTDSVYIITVRYTIHVQNLGGNTEKSHGMAVAALQAADEYLKESKKACEAFNLAIPLSR